MLRRQGEVKTIPILAGIGKARRVVGHRQVRNRWFAIKLESQKMFDRIAGKFGLVGPVSRSGLEVQHSSAQDDDELAAILAKPFVRRPKPPEQLEWESRQQQATEPPPEPVQ